MDQLAEYSVTQFPIRQGSFVATHTVTGQNPAASVAAVYKAADLFGSCRLTRQKHALLCLSSIGCSVAPGVSNSCQNFCGYHEAIGGQTYYAVMPYPSCSGCLGGLSTFNALTATSSHEFSEAITGPLPGQGWYDDNSGEIGDICAGQFKQLENYTVQLEWSDKAGRCM
jgi:hypothetical protein